MFRETGTLRKSKKSKSNFSCNKHFNGKINELSYLHINHQHSAAWKTVNELSGKGCKPATTLKGGCREKRLENWVSHFKNLLGKPATLPENKTLPKLQVCNSLNIPTGKFTIAELIQVLKSVKIKLLAQTKYQLSCGKIPFFTNCLSIFVTLLLKTMYHHQYGSNRKSFLFQKKVI